MFNKSNKPYLVFLFIIILFIVIKQLNIKKVNYKKIEKFSNDNEIIIVGNAPYDKNKKNGKLINSFKNVVRFNNFNTDKEHRDYVGSKIDYWCISCFVYHSNKKLFEEKKKNNIENILVIKPEVFLNRYPYKKKDKTKLLIQNRDIFVPKKYNFNKKWPSTGLFAVLYFLQTYSKVHITGFNHFDEKQGSIHYYENLKQLGHKGDLEKTIFNDLKSNGKIITI
jgi:hypothetical protein